ncbi:MAG: FG-GAP-like repeat-containing protein [Terriglobales bacterium]
MGVLLGNGNGTFQAAITYSSGGQDPTSIAAVDVNGDGKPDLLVANACVSVGSCANGVIGVLLGNGDGTFETPVTYGSGYQPLSVAVADVNGDGKQDAVVANFSATCNNCSNGGVSVLLGNGDGTSQTAVSYGSGGLDAYGAAVADVNGDGKPDLLVANFCEITSPCTSGIVGVLLNTSTEVTTAGLIASLNPSGFGQSLTFTATVTPQGNGTPTGTVNFMDGTTNLGSSLVNGAGVALFATSMLSVGTHSITAAYGGDSNFAPSTSSVLNQVVQGAIATLSSNNLDFGQQTVGVISAPMVVALMNAGNISLTLSAIGITGTNSTDFAQTNTCGASVAAGGSCQYYRDPHPNGHRRAQCCREHCR